jgi:hypothetical protein
MTAIRFLAPMAASVLLAACGSGGSGGATDPAANRAPGISSIAPAIVAKDASSQPLQFTVTDRETPADQLVVVAESSDPALIDADGILLAGSGGVRTLTLRPVEDRSGQALITVRVRDADGLEATTRVALRVEAQPASFRSLASGAFAASENDASAPLRGLEIAPDADTDPHAFDALLGGS